MPKFVQHISSGHVCCDAAWEDAYRRFETADQEVEKFSRRLRAFQILNDGSDQKIVELFCGRGNGLVALAGLGFDNLMGVDLSPSLLEQYSGPAELHLADCRDLPFERDSFDAAIVHGGLHHLPLLPSDLERVLTNVARILRPSGKFYVVEPWLTPFLTFVHAIVEQPLVRRFYDRGDALAKMIELERETYDQWLSQPELILSVFEQHFQILKKQQAWGKLTLVGQPR